MARTHLNFPGSRARLFRCSALGLLFLSGTIWGQDVNEDKLPGELAERLAKVQIAFRSGSMNSPGAAVSFKEMSRSKDSQGTAVRYRLFASGLPKDRVYEILTTSFDLKPSVALDGVTFDRSGQAICAGTTETCGDPSEPNDPVNLVVYAGRGEAKRYSVVSEDRQFKADGSIVPFPVTGADRGCSVEAVLLLPGGQAMLLHGTGFASHSTLHISGVSEGETKTGDVTSSEEGTFDSALLPGVKGKSKGRFQVNVQSQTCNPSVSTVWGSDTYRLQ